MKVKKMKREEEEGRQDGRGKRLHIFHISYRFRCKT